MMDSEGILKDLLRIRGTLIGLGASISDVERINKLIRYFEKR